MRAVSVAVFAGMLGSAFVIPAPAARAVSFTEKVLWSFGSGTDGTNPHAGLIDVSGTLYGTTAFGGGTGCDGYGCGTVFSIDPDTGAETPVYSFCSRKDCRDGDYPYAGLIDVRGALYGTTSSGGTSTGCDGSGCGTVFSIDPSTGAEAVLYSFFGGTDGANPNASLIDVKGTLYGTTYNGGAYGYGTVFSLTKNR
jgi:uncharacterized repeat protein (TIGR03803 family)